MSQSMKLLSSVVGAAGYRELGEDCGSGGDAAEDAFPFRHFSGGFQSVVVGYGNDFVNDFQVQYLWDEPGPDALNQVGTGAFFSYR